MNSRRWPGWLTAALLLACCASAAAADDVTLLRVFLTDGSALVSYGEPARIGDRLVFSMPTAATPNAPLPLFDEAIADLRAATGDARFDLSLAAFVDPPPVGDMLAPAPTPKETIEQVLTAARVADTAGERTALLETALASLDRDAATLPAEWVAATRAATKAQVETARRTDRAYQVLTARILGEADRHARAADVGSL